MSKPVALYFHFCGFSCKMVIICTNVDEVGVTGCRELPACHGQDEVTCDGGGCVYQSPCSALMSVCCGCLFSA